MRTGRCTTSKETLVDVEHHDIFTLAKSLISHTISGLDAVQKTTSTIPYVRMPSYHKGFGTLIAGERSDRKMGRNCRLTIVGAEVKKKEEEEDENAEEIRGESQRVTVGQIGHP